MGMFLRRGKPKLFTVLISAPVSNTLYNAYARAKVNGNLVTAETSFDMHKGDIVTIETNSYNAYSGDYGVYVNGTRVSSGGTYNYEVTGDATITMSMYSGYDSSDTAYFLATCRIITA